MTLKNLLKAAAIQGFLEAHAHAAKYVFQLKKCSRPDCNYYQEHPVRIPESFLSNISFLPLPCLDSSKDHYKEFSSVYGQMLSEEDNHRIFQ